LIEIRFVDLNGDGRADICGRGIDGIWCGLSLGSSFSQPTLWSTQFSNAKDWQSDPGYWSTIQYADINRDDKPDVCGRAAIGIICAINNSGTGTGYAHPGFVNLGVWTTQFSDATGWKVSQYYSTIKLADIDGDRQADVCGRGQDGLLRAVHGRRPSWTLTPYTPRSSATATVGIPLTATLTPG
jgi:hypothetical protein